MPWRDRLQPASFRGVAFEVETSTDNLGRRTVVHQYPGNDEHWVEDLGLGGDAKPLRVQGFVVGEDYDQRRDELIEAANSAEPGTLIHPRFGAIEVIASDESSLQESTREGGLATFSLVFIRVGTRQFPSTEVDSVSVAESAITDGLSAVQSDFAVLFSVADLPAYLSTSATEWLDLGLDALQPFIDVADTASALNATVDILSAQFDSLLATPGNLADQTIQALSSIFDTGSNSSSSNSSSGGAVSDISTALAMEPAIVAALAAIEPIVTTTASRESQADNLSAVTDLFVVSAGLLASRAVVQLSPGVGVDANASPFDSRDHAAGVLDELVAMLDLSIETAHDDLYEALRTVKPALVKHINAHGFGLASVEQYTPRAELPALVLTHQLYGDIGADASREAELVQRNNVRFPAFVPAGEPLEYLALS